MFGPGKFVIIQICWRSGGQYRNWWFSSWIPIGVLALPSLVE